MKLTKQHVARLINEDRKRKIALAQISRHSKNKKCQK